MGPECEFVLEHYNDYISGELDPAGSQRIEEHVEVCPRCETFLGRYTALHLKAVRLLRISAPNTLRESISEMMAKV